MVGRSGTPTPVLTGGPTPSFARGAGLMIPLGKPAGPIAQAIARSPPAAPSSRLEVQAHGHAAGEAGGSPVLRDQGSGPCDEAGPARTQRCRRGWRRHQEMV